ncbi:SRPBCC family protein [Halosegnis sp.]|uniref:SRPBCC family protein n=1 Tax=Halosegnis sp. TaxID=2864959 RepID=UPI0035D5158F
MTVRVERTFEFDAPPSAIWAFIADPEKRARPISVVTDFETTGDRTATWQLKLPIPFTNRTIAVETEDIERRENEFVRFVGTSKVMKVQGEHELEETATGSLLHNRFVVDGRAPGVERFFKRNLDGELDNIEAAINETLTE